MANNCSEDYVFYGMGEEAEEELTALYELMQKCLEESGRYGCWIGEFSAKMGLGEPTMCCRSALYVLDEPEENGAFRASFDSAWCSYHEFWEWFLEKAFPHTKYARRAVEPGCGIFEKFDPDGQFFPENYLVETMDMYDLTGECYDGDYFITVEDMLKDVNQKLGWNASSLSELKEIADDYEEPDDPDAPPAGRIWVREFVEVSA